MAIWYETITQTYGLSAEMTFTLFLERKQEERGGIQTQSDLELLEAENKGF